ncbi:MAG: DUF885 domain-containing protein [Bacteriovoracaceae bacterium]|nr:DUF885 domain-containing protein [Bacteriovoracaceae bacterium]
MLFIKIISNLSFFFLLMACSSYSNLSPIKESKKLNQFFEEEFEKQIQRYPTSQTYLGRKTNYDKLDNHTIEFKNQTYQLANKSLKRLRKIHYKILNRQDQISYRIYEYQLKMTIESQKWMYHSYPLNQMFGYHADTPAFLINMHRIDNFDDAQDYISRLKEIRRVFSEKMVFLKEQNKRHIFPPHFVFQKILSDSKNIITGAPFTKSQEDSPLLKDFKNKISKLNISSKKTNQLIEQAKSTLIKYVQPAYKELISYTQNLNQKVRTNHGAWSLPQGKDYYHFRLKKMTTSHLSPDEIHRLGLKEVKRIHAEMKKVMQKTGFKGSLQDFFQYMKSERFLYPQNEAGRKKYINKVHSVISKMEKALPKIFNTFPKAELKVKPVESFREKSAGIAFYNGPSLEGNRPGIYYVNLYKMQDNPKYKLEALTYHEAIPGHHMQIAIQKELKGLPKFRRTRGFTAFSEGWGLYAELLPKEIGFYSNPYSDFGRLSMELWRATRMVVDTGIHAKKWSREYAINYLKDKTPSAKLEIMKAVERYFVMPAQATAYKVGMLKILNLRSLAKKELKENFNLAEFHDVILKNGSVPLFILEENIKTWIENQ